MKRALSVIFVLFICVVSFSSCGNDEPTIPPQKTGEEVGEVINPASVPNVSDGSSENLPPLVINTINLQQGQVLKKLTPIAITFTKEMAEVKIRVINEAGDEAIGITTLNGATATWTPSEIEPGVKQLLFISGFDKSGRFLAFGPIEFFFDFPPKSPGLIIFESSVADLWFSGNIGSKWEYSCNEKLIACSLVKEVEDKETGKRYKIVEESEPFISEITPNRGAPVCPFLIFRKEGESRIVGFGQAVNESMQATMDMLIHQGLKGTLSFDDLMMLKTEFDSTREWVVLDKASLTKRNLWIVATIKIKVLLKGNEMASGRVEVRGLPAGENFFKVGEKKMAGIRVMYDMFGTVTGKGGGNSISAPLCQIILVPGVGIFSVTTPESTGTLVDYNIVF